jgi:hypothetical protein
MSIESVLAFLQTIDRPGISLPLDIILATDIPIIREQAKLDNALAHLHLDLLSQGTKHLPPITKCFLCECLLTRKAIVKFKIGAYVLDSAQLNKPTIGLINFICTDCAADDWTLNERVAARYRELLVANARILAMPAELELLDAAMKETR